MQNRTSLTNLLLAFSIFLYVNPASAAILWVGGEDIDFPDLSGGASVNYMSCAGGSSCRLTYPRHALTLSPSTGWVMSNPFPAGPITSAWLSVRMSYSGGGQAIRHIGFGKSGSGPVLGIGSSFSGISLSKYNGTSWTELAFLSPGAPIGLIKLDMQVTDYGATGNVKIYVNGAVSPSLNYTGNIAGVPANLDTVFISGPLAMSEIIVADTDTRQLSLVTLAPNAAGDLSEWSGACTDIAPTLVAPLTYISADTADHQRTCNLANLNAAIPSASRVLAVKAASYGYTPGGTVTAYSLGVKTNASISASAAMVQDATWKTNETYFLANPVTTTAWTVNDLNALQLYLKSAAP